MTNPAQSPMEGHESEIAAVLDAFNARSQRTARMSLGLGVVLLVAATAWLWWTFVQVRTLQGRREALASQIDGLQAVRDSLLRDLGWSQDMLNRGASDTMAIQTALRASTLRRQTLQANTAAVRSGVKVLIYSRGIDRAVVTRELSGIGYDVSIETANPTIPKDYQTNAIFYGTRVPLEDVRLVALTLVRAGIQLRELELVTSARRAMVIQVGSLYPSDKAPMSVDDIVAATQRR